ncbi:hypothetical protein METBIDRAFT_36323 [Metschnikowia bicuspidata var. bicuspidata NRRL YB-4993]|uniref:Uncharacterized protein n=1 Tax=Metschnikowia bicuspidata var. bicuspidata NRRL YB-4993 TaxID=869754 RepID=A0A1A0HH45_9ASCO|nr:hypothetical protein METBIDRAFT_36323 [Metschnikowia bicuspidata var. bicuspidata NRRL YB-4993]OBA23168.1 hypothetical protein METBIDRAFT_36323 [Metschnikowia bicuspidata var. bicuspidata NRRL YB-4993]
MFGQKSVLVLRSAIARSAALATCRRNFSGPLVKSYAALKTPMSVFWAQNVPLTAKYASALVATAVGITHIHPNTCITVGPPALAAAYFLYRRHEHAQYKSLLALVKPEKGSALEDKTVKIQNYNAADEANVLAGIENEYDSFRSQIIPVVRSKLVEYAMEMDREGKPSKITQQLLDENKQIVVHVDEDPETFVTLKAESEHEGFFPVFVSFSVPCFTSRNVKLRRRLGTLQVSMLEMKGEDSESETFKEYRLAIQAWPYMMFSKSERVY